MARRRRKKSRFRLIFEYFLPLALLLAAVLGLVSGYVAWRVTHPAPGPQVVDPSSYLLTFREFRWKGAGSAELSGWFVPGREGAPAIFLCHGYGSNRSQTLSLTERLHAAGFSAVILGLRGHEGAPEEASTLGWLEAQDLLLARDALRREKLLADQKLGAWGVDLGAYSALAAASGDRDFRAVVADTPYFAVRRYLDYRTHRFAGGEYGLLGWGTGKAFSLLSGGGFSGRPPSLEPGSLGRLQLLVLLSEADPERARLPESFLKTLPEEQVVRLPRTRADELHGPAQEAYDQRVTAFFEAVQW